MPNARWTAADLPDMTGRTVVVTGASSGIGAATARALAAAGATVVLAVRDVGKGERVAATITGHTEVRELDLASLASVRAFAAVWTGDLDILVNNAGIMMVPEGRTTDGFERQIGTNHLGPFALTNLLLPRITDRIVTVSSNAHERGRIDLDDLNWERRPYRAGQAYSDSKLANLLFTFELQRRLAGAGSSVRALAVHPGMVRTNLFGHATGVAATLIGTPSGRSSCRTPSTAHVPRCSRRPGHPGRLVRGTRRTRPPARPPGHRDGVARRLRRRARRTALGSLRAAHRPRVVGRRPRWGRLVTVGFEVQG